MVIALALGLLGWGGYVASRAELDVFPEFVAPQVMIQAEAPGLSAEQKKALIDLVVKMANGPTWKSELEKKDWTGILLTGDAFGTYLDSEITRITGILTDLGLASK
jgi:tripartite-type tricarboxylate transporter receptor subunit TctC